MYPPKTTNLTVISNIVRINVWEVFLVCVCMRVCFLKTKWGRTWPQGRGAPSPADLPEGSAVCWNVSLSLWSLCWWQRHRTMREMMMTGWMRWNDHVCINIQKRHKSVEERKHRAAKTASTLLLSAFPKTIVTHLLSPTSALMCWNCPL